MFREPDTDDLVIDSRFGVKTGAASAGNWTGRRRSGRMPEVRVPDGGRSAARAGLLSEGEAAAYLGMPTAALVGLRKFDLAMIEKGFRPHGPPPLWQGGMCSYAKESLKEWIRSQSDGHRAGGRRAGSAGG
jgi:hypothetical protein